MATSSGVGFVEMQKDRTPLADNDAWLQRTAPPDHRDRHLRLGVRRGLVRSADRVLLVDWMWTGGQTLGAQALVEAAGGAWRRATVIVDGLSDNQLRRCPQVRSLLHVRDL